MNAIGRTADSFDEWRQTRGQSAEPAEVDSELCVVMERVWSDIQVQKRAQDSLGVWNENEKPKGFSSQLFFWGVIVFLFIPFIGWIVGIIMIVAAFWDGKAPEERGQQDAERYAQLKRELGNCYRNVSCPKCGSNLVRDGDEFFVFLEDPEGLDCRICGTRLIRRRETLSVFHD